MVCADGWHPCVRCLPDGRRWHLQQGPIDLIVAADGQPDEVAAAVDQAVTAFTGLLDTLVAELGELRRGREPSAATSAAGLQPAWRVVGPVARRMCAAVMPFRTVFVTPMIAVAGAVADQVLAALLAKRELHRAYVNNGGDIALYLTPGQRFSVGLPFGKPFGKPFGEPVAASVAVADHASRMPRLQLTAGDAVGGVATSGWRGRSHSLGIADAVTVLAGCAATADLAATLIANAVDVPGCSRIERVPAQDLDETSDLGQRLVTVDVGRLSTAERAAAVDAGATVARRLQAEGWISGCRLTLQGCTAVVGRRDCWLD